MALRGELEGVSGALGKLREAAESASGALEGIGSSSGGGAGGGLGAGGRGAGAGGLLRGLAKSGLAAGIAAAGEVGQALGEAATPALSAFNATGSLEAGAGAGILSLAEQFRHSGALGSFVSELTGASDTLDVIGRTKGRVSGITEDLARAGVGVPDDFRQALIDRTLDQEKRVQDERQRVEGELGKFGNIQKAGGDSAFSSMIGLLSEIRDSLKGGTAAAVR